MHESTVSRVTANKYIATPRGTFELKYFFTTAIAWYRRREPQRRGGAPSHPRHDRRRDGRTTSCPMTRSWPCCGGEGVDIARRTVAKYREALRIPNSVQRRREKAVPA